MRTSANGRRTTHPHMTFLLKLFTSPGFLNSILHAHSTILPANINDLPLKRWDKGVFDYEIGQQHDTHPGNSNGPHSSPQISEGTYTGTQLALTEMFHRIENSYKVWCDFVGVETHIPRPLSLEQKRKLYRYQSPKKDRYPPHLDVIPTKDQASDFQIFNKLGLVQAIGILPKIVPKTFVSRVASEIMEQFQEWMYGNPEKGFTMADIERQNKLNRKSGTDVMRGANIGDLKDWYTDARFAQQYLTGPNPVTLRHASEELLAEFRQSAETQGKTEFIQLIETSPASSLYVVDYSYLRHAFGLNPKDQILAESQEDDEDFPRYGCAPVVLFHLHDDGNLHPISIVIDYKGSMKDSVVIFNGNMSHSQSGGETWPWRYAKTLVQSADWTVHELGTHLVSTHFVEESIIVATHRCIPAQNVIFQLLQPHWYRTLSLNAAARETLVPSIVLAMVGYGQKQGLNFIQHAYRGFDFQGKYVPRDLKDRGFPEEYLHLPRFRNCAYARNISAIWQLIRKLVKSMLSLHYKSDEEVNDDKHIADWCKEIQSPTGAQIPTFPTITTLDQLVDAVTMCIHTASPQHTAVNYLQTYYYCFVVNKPPGLFQPLPPNLSSLQAVDEAFLVKSLPIGHQRQWLLASHIPWLLSFRPAAENNLINYAASLWNLYKRKGEDVKGPQVAEIAKTFYEDLRDLIVVIETHSKEMGKKQRIVPYRVLDPRENAVSILI